MKKITLLILTMIASYSLTAQVAINNDGSAPDGSAMLDVKSTNSGFLLPRMNTMQISDISNPAAGLMVFNTDSSDFYGFNGSMWISLWNTGDTIDVFSCGDPLADSHDGQTYATVQIGTQCWMAENLNIGTMINGSNDQSQQTPEVIEKYCHENNTSNCDIYGGLYQWAEMVQYLNGATNETSWDPVPTGNVQGICPTGWHLPTDDEWKTMEMQLGMSQSEADNTSWRGTDEGEKLKSTSGWYSGGNGTNSSGFTALPGGYRYMSGDFAGLSYDGTWRSATEVVSDMDWCRHMDCDRDKVHRSDWSKDNGLSVRCLRD